MHPIAAVSLNPELTLEEADSLHTQGFNVIFDGDNQTHLITLDAQQEGGDDDDTPPLPPAA